MKRILISQNEKNNGEDYVVVDGQLINDEDLCLKYSKKVRETDNWKQNYRDDFLELKSNNTAIFIKSHYLNKDSGNRNIYYMYLIEQNDDLDMVLEFLEKDSKMIHREIDKEKTKEIINKIKANKRLKSNLFILLLVLAAASFIYFISTNSNHNNENKHAESSTFSRR